MRKTKSMEQRVWSRVARRGDDDCWLWQGAHGPSGYGYFRDYSTGKAWRAHRAAWLVTNGPIPDGLAVCHKCDVRDCCNPRHLFLGTYYDNYQDAKRKGRHTRGTIVWTAKLTDERVRCIRTEFAGGGVTKRAIAARHGVSESSIGLIVRGKTWAHVGWL